MYRFNVWRDPYDMGWNTTRAREIELKTGLTVLVGCNGSGKTTLIQNIERSIRNERLPIYVWNNLHDGGSTALSSYLLHDNTMAMVDVWSSSEGEAILKNIGYESQKFRNFIYSGDIKSRNPFESIFGSEEKLITNKRFMLFDAVDSGLSIDMVDELKHLFDLMLKDAEQWNIELYIIVSCNEFELAHNEQCINVCSGKYINISTYEDFKKTVLATRRTKDKRNGEATNE